LVSILPVIFTEEGISRQDLGVAGYWKIEPAQLVNGFIQKEKGGTVLLNVENRTFPIFDSISWGAREDRKSIRFLQNVAESPKLNI
jgi:hypothetical protein